MFARVLLRHFFLRGLLAGGFELGVRIVVERDARSRHVLLKMLHRAGPGNRHHHGGAAEQPGQRNLGGSGTQALGCLIQQSARLCELAG
jgi:type IV secretory pathway VirB3-like protein